MVGELSSKAVVNSNATTQVKTGSGVLKRITVLDPGTTWQAILYDDTAGTSNTLGTYKSAAGGGNMDFGVTFVNGLKVVTSGTTPGSLVFVYE